MIVGAAFSFDWDLVQSSVARFTSVCTFDPSGTAWSDPYPNAMRVLDPDALCARLQHARTVWLRSAA
jgi:hypothetical protein